MDFRDTAEEAAFRKELRAWFEENLPAERPQSGEAWVNAAKGWARKLFDAGYSGLTWPKEFGGQGAPYTYQAIFLEEIARVDGPEHIGVIGLGMAWPTIIAHGTDEQKSRYLQNILSGEEVWCQGFSEPGSGSDLASLKTKAVLDGDEFVVNGQKVWSSFAHIADHCILLVRTDPDAQKHKGITYLLADMHAPGVEVRPLTQITGDPEFNEIFFNDVRIPKANVLGEINDGWRVAMTTLMHERGTLGFALTARLEVALKKLIETAKLERSDGVVPANDPVVREKIAQLYVDLQGLRFTNYRALTGLVKTGIPGPEGSIAKLHWSETNQRLTKLALEVLGPDAMLDEKDGLWNGYWQYAQLRSRGNTIEAGTSEVLRNIVSERVLGLPRSR